MPLSSGEKLSHYEILASIGAGGMGEVYKARDTRLDRIVAIKVLPEHIAKREDLKARFEREARAVASLNHPHICVLFDIGEEQGTSFMVLEHLEGETIESRLQRGALPLDTALQYAMQTADALDRAHRAGVTHRDIKPANLMLTRDGVKVLDFGLAKSTAKPGPTEATIVASLTSEGTVLGTPQYMAPEQFEGKEADPRADVWAFGAVLYEMLSGRKAFEGKNYSSLVGAILSTDPAPVTPAWLERIVRRCLQKDPEDRYQSIRDVLLDLRAGGPEPERKSPAKRTWLAWAVAAGGIIAAVALALLHLQQEAPATYTASLLPPNKTYFGDFAVSPDGKTLAFTALDGAKRQLYVRALDTKGAQLLTGTEDAASPFWSPDSRSIGYFALGKLKRISAAGGASQTLCDAPAPRGGSWNEQGIILFAGTASAIMRVSDQGGTPSPVALADKRSDAFSDRWPYFLPGGKAFLHTLSALAGTEATGVYWAELETGRSKRLLTDRTSSAYAEDHRGRGYLLFVREGILMGQSLDAKEGVLHGSAFPLAEHVLFNSLHAKGDFSASAQGLLVYASEGSRGVRQLAWLSRSGERIAGVGRPNLVRHPALSPDEKRIAYDIGYGGNGADVWIHEMDRDVSTRLTFDPGVEYYPIWSPDGTKIAYSAGAGSKMDLFLRTVNGEGAPQSLWTSPHSKFTLDWSATAGVLLFSQIAPQTKLDVYALPLTGERKPVALLTGPYMEQSATLSPDGKYLAYVSDESGRNEIFVQTYPPSGAKWQVSSTGGICPRWRKDGREIFYLNEGSLMAVDVLSGPGFRMGVPTRLFTVNVRQDLEATTERFAVSGDGKRFLFALSVDDSASDSAPTIVFNALDRARP